MVTFALTTLTADEEALRTEVRSFLADVLPADFRPGLGLAAAHDPAFSRALAQQGWVGMAIPTAYGGHDRSAVDRFVVTEELLAAGAPIGAHFIADRQTAPALLRFGTEAQRTRFLPAIAAGECYFSLGMSEPDAGSDLAAVKSKAEPVPGGWLLNGTKVWTSNAHLNQYFAVLCRTAQRDEDRHVGLSQLIVDLRADGVTIRPIRLLDGTVHFNEVVMENVFVPDELVLGDPGAGWAQVTAELAYERSGPDRYLSTFPVIREFLRAVQTSPDRQDMVVGESLGRIWSRLRAIRWLSLSVARALDAGSAPATEAALVKDIGTAFEQLSLELMRLAAVEPVDPIGDSQFEQLMAEAVLIGPSFTLRGGTTEVLRTVTARGLGR